MRKRIILLIGILFLLTGCDGEYNITISSNKIKETFLINNTDVKSWNVAPSSYKNTILEYYTKPLACDINNPALVEETIENSKYNYYKKKLINSSSNYGLEYYYNFSMDEYTNSTFPNYLFYSFNTNYSSSYFSLNAYDCSNIFAYYPLLDKIVVKISTDYLVNSNNADKIINNDYYWYITKDNYSKKKIKFNCSLNEKYDSKLNIDKNFNMYIIGIVVLILIISIFVFIKVRKSNK